MASDRNEPPRSPWSFPVTAWSLVRLAVAEGRQGADRALDKLCRMYERPVLAWILKSGCAPDAAQDLKQAFFAHLLARNALAEAEGTRVKLRAFLITKLQGFLVDQHRHAQAQKRGAGRVVRQADLSETDAALAEPAHEVTPFIAYQRQWMDTLAATAMERLRADYAARGQGALFEALAPFITQENEQTLAALSSQLGRPAGTLKSDVSRLRARCQGLIREQVAATLEDPSPANIDAELKELMGYRA